MSDFMALAGLYLAQLLVIAGATEGSVQGIKLLIESVIPVKLQPKEDQLLAMIVAMVAALLLPIIQLNVNPSLLWGLKIVGGLLASRGSNFIHDLSNIVMGYAAVVKAKGTGATTTGTSGKKIR